MKNNSNIRCWIITIVILSVIFVLFVCVVYFINDVTIAFSVPLDNDITISFFTIIAANITPTIALISALLYYEALIEQKRQNAKLYLQHFEEQYNNLLERQSKIRDQFYVIHPLIISGIKKNVRYQGIAAFKRLWLTYQLLIKAVNSHTNYYNWEQIEAGYDNKKMNLDPNGVLEHFEPKELDKKIDELNMQYDIAMIGHIFNIDGSQQISNVELEAFRMIYDKFFRASSLYFTHLCSILKFLKHNVGLYSIESEQQEAYIQRLRDNLSNVELCVIGSYAKFDLNNKRTILKKDDFLLNE